MPQDVKFCTKCGHSFEDENVSKKVNGQKFNKKTTRALLIFLAVLFLIVICSIFYSQYSEYREARLAREKFVADSLAKVKQDSIRIANEMEKARLDSIENERIKSLQEPYLSLLERYEAIEDVYDGQLYFLYDITGDKFPELWVQIYDGDGENQIDYRIHVYTIANGKSKLLYNGNVLAHSSFCEGVNYVICEYAHMGYQEISKFTYSNGKIKAKQIYKNDDYQADYKEIEEPLVTTYKLTDKNPIYELR